MLPVIASADDAGRIVVGARSQRRIGAGESHTYNFEARAGRYLRFEIGRSTVRVVFTVTGASGRQSVELDCLRCESVSLSVLTGSGGTYHLIVKSEESGAATGQYDLALIEDRAVSSGDRSRMTAERALAEGDALRVEWNANSLRKALDRYRAALAGWQAAGDPSGQSRALRAIGDVYRAMGELKKAQDSYTLAHNLARDHDRLKQGAALGLGFTSIFMGDTQKAITHGAEALALSTRVEDRSGEARALICLGDAYYDLSDMTKAAEHYEHALTIAGKAEDLYGQAKALNGLAYVNGNIPEKQSMALRHHADALERWRLLGDRRGQANTLVALGHLTSFMGEKQQALAYYHEAEPSVRNCGEPATVATLYAGLGFVYEGLGELGPALQHYLKALSAWQAAKYRNAEAEALTKVGRLYGQLGDSPRALDYLLRAREITRSLRDPSTEACVLTYIGEVYTAMGRSTEALACYQEVLTDRSHAKPWIRAQALTGVGKIYQRRGDCKEAANWYGRALAASSEAHEPSGEVAALSNRARAERDCGNFDAALMTLNGAISRIELLRDKMAGQSMRASYFATARGTYELTIDVLSRLDMREPDRGYAERALEVSERALARSLLDTLVEARANLFPENNPALVEEERGLLASMVEKNQLLAQLSAGKAPRTQLETVEREIEVLVERHRVVQSLMRAANPRHAALTQPQPLKLREIQQQVLDSETLLLEYALGDERSYLWAVTLDSIATFELPRRAEIEKAARRVYQLLTAQNQIIQGETEERRNARIQKAEADYVKEAAELSRTILGPVASELANKRLLIVADGALQYVPFGALPAPQGSGVGGQRSGAENRTTGNEQRTTDEYKPLVLGHEIVNLPSASALAVLRREIADRKPAPKTVAVIADPVFSRNDSRLKLSATRAGAQMRSQVLTRDFERAIKGAGVKRSGDGLERLPFSRREADAIMSVAPEGQAMKAIDFDASRATAMSGELGQYKIVHFATHGLLNSEHPELSGIVLSLVDREGQPQNGFLRLHEVYNLSLPAELVVLSACQTGLGKEIKGEGLVGLTRGFMYAGAARVMASLWKVDDAATAELMKRFYAKLLGSHKRPAAALREAQIEMWKQTNKKSPYYWAGFVLQGEWK